jgi:hypothetical protein
MSGASGLDRNAAGWLPDLRIHCCAVSQVPFNVLICELFKAYRRGEMGFFFRSRGFDWQVLVVASSHKTFCCNGWGKPYMYLI